VKTKTLKIIVTTFLIALTLGIYIGHSQTPTSTFYISPGPYPGIPSYIIWREGNNYFAKTRYGELKFSGTDATTVLNNALAIGEHVYLGRGTFTISGKVSLILNGTILQGSGAATILDIQANSGIEVGSTASTLYEDIVIRDMKIRTSYDNAVPMVLFINARRCGIQNVIFESDVSSASNLVAMKFDAYNQAGSGIENYVDNVEIWGQSTSNFNIGIYLTSSGTRTNRYITITRTRVHSAVTGILSERGSATFAPDSLYLSDLSLDDLTLGIKFDQSWLNRVYNVRFETVTTGINLTSGANRNHFYSLMFASDVTTQVIDSGNYNLFIDCYNYRTESYGATTVANGEWIPHGLVGVPRFISLTVGTPTYGGVTVIISTWKTLVNSTHFPVSVRWINGTAITTDGVIWVYWYATTNDRAS